MSEPAANEEWKSSLKNILTAFAQLDPETYYVQGMNFLAAELLEILSEEVRKDTFLNFWPSSSIISIDSDLFQ